jgi:hypothetical protein
LRASVYRTLERRPTAYCFVARHRITTVNVVDRRTDLVIEGFPRSGNSFAREAVLLSNPTLRVASHLHAAAHAIAAVRWGVPTLILVRDVDAAVSSLLVRNRETDAGRLFGDYLRFYSALQPYRDRVVVAAFDEVVGDFGHVVERVNQRFGLTLVPFEHTPANRDRVFARLDGAARIDDAIDERIVSRPSEWRRQALVADPPPWMGEYAEERAACRAIADEFAVTLNATG